MINVLVSRVRYIHKRVINRKIPSRWESEGVRLRPQFSLPERVLNVMEDTMLLGVYHRKKCDRRLLMWSFKAKVKRSLKRYISELGPAKLLLLL